ncbi:MAG: flavodoxin [Firmicutes bacterium HGW-Firmicutes-7]|nr:MAG: flavodoxin [Firmicutes bacterium HGW-Firmicutes-7]
MNEILVVFWSGTGNTEDMALAISEGIKNAGFAAVVKNVSEISPEEVNKYNCIVFGCPSMGDEVLEEDEFEPFFAVVEGLIEGKKIALFGSYGWGDGQWMKDWQDRVTRSGAQLFSEGLIINESPDEEGLEKCRIFGGGFVTF